jgi:hypothetical protein
MMAGAAIITALAMAAVNRRFEGVMVFPPFDAASPIFSDSQSQSGDVAGAGVNAR